MASSSTALAKIEELQKQITSLKQQAVEELKAKLTEARRAVAALEAELAELTGQPASEPRARRVRRPSITDEELRLLILKAMSAEGRNGMNAKAIATRVGQDALRIRKFLNGNPKVLKRQGSGPGTKFFLP